jgi:hypothetical protein
MEYGKGVIARRTGVVAIRCDAAGEDQLGAHRSELLREDLRRRPGVARAPRVVQEDHGLFIKPVSSTGRPLRFLLTEFSTAKFVKAGLQGYWVFQNLKYIQPEDKEADFLFMVYLPKLLSN